jgi:predicted nuclease with TOPRIM domain
LEAELSSCQATMKAEMDKFYQLKKDYHDLRDHLTSILTENIQLKEQMEEKQAKSLFS